MDGLLGTILAGVVVAVIGAFAAYYFGVRQERVKLAFQREREEQGRLAEQQKERDERSAETLTEIKTRASVVVENVRSWAENAVASLDPAKLPDTGFWESKITASATQIELLQKYAEIVQQRDSIAEKMNSLRLYFSQQTPYLSGAQRSLFETFDNEFERRYSPLSAKLPSYEIVRQRFTATHGRENLSGGEKFRMGIGAFGDLVSFGQSQFSRDLSEGDPNRVLYAGAIRNWEEEWARIPEAARHARNWDFRHHQVAFDQEIERLTGTST